MQAAVELNENQLARTTTMIRLPDLESVIG